MAQTSGAGHLATALRLGIIGRGYGTHYQIPARFLIRGQRSLALGPVLLRLDRLDGALKAPVPSIERSVGGANRGYMSTPQHFMPMTISDLCECPPDSRLDPRTDWLPFSILQRDYLTMRIHTGRRLVNDLVLADFKVIELDRRFHLLLLRVSLSIKLAFLPACRRLQTKPRRTSQRPPVARQWL